MISNRYLFSLLGIFIILFSLPVFSQTAEEMEGRMNKIKLDGKNVFGEDTNGSEEKALKNALYDLLVTANESRGENGLPNLSVEDIQGNVTTLNYKKGGRYTYLVYLPLSQIMKMQPGGGREDTAYTPPPPQKETSPATPSRPTSPAVPARQEPPRQETPSYPAMPTAQNSVLPGTVLETLSAQDNWVEIKGFLGRFKKEGKISETGAETSFVQVPADAYAILIDDKGGILAILSPKNSSNRINYKTNKEDNESNYSNCKFIVWYR